MSIIIIFISRLPERHMPIELATIKQQNSRKNCKNQKYKKVRNMKNTTNATRPKPNNYSHISIKLKSKVADRYDCRVESLFGESFSWTGAQSVTERQRQEGGVTRPAGTPLSSIVAQPALWVVLQRSREILLHATGRRHVGKYEHLPQAYPSSAPVAIGKTIHLKSV